MARTKKKIVRREWTKDDVRQLKTMAKAKAGVTKISKSLKRTSGIYERDGSKAWCIAIDARLTQPDWPALHPCVASLFR